MSKQNIKHIDVPIYFTDLTKQKQREIKKLVGNTILPSPLTTIPIEYEDYVSFESNGGLLPEEDDNG